MTKFENFIKSQIVHTLPQVLPSWAKQSDNTGGKEMSKFKGTTGPWYRSGKTVYALNEQGFNRFSALVQGAHTSDEELEAIARLIAAAPELLEALIMCYQSMSSVLPDFNPFDQAAYDRARAAIAKAEGEA